MEAVRMFRATAVESFSSNGVECDVAMKTHFLHCYWLICLLTMSNSEHFLHIHHFFNVLYVFSLHHIINVALCLL